ncbi:hypothetical protein [Tautonia sociabilis]|uniref:Uncharacterized protein n=1 Tax=Tautonia sociabilis TaxID=2080755 RepID=A0A432MKU9_9BACT|nr:hypothetical protein [Tautonia sociabilis]RUL87765.1 hypothetical protein TsocGM_10405 [Tautonia sociabilis]
MGIRSAGRGVVAALAAGLIAVAAGGIGCGRSPEMGADEEVFRTVDAMYTAVSLRDVGQLSRNAEAIDRLHREGRLPDAAHRALGRIVDRAEQGDWEAARSRLRDFMLDQRR